MNRITRRQALKGLGVTVGLPFLESLARAAGPAAAPPTRLVAMSFGLGIMPDSWSASGRGADMRLGYSLEPLRPLASELTFFDGLFHPACLVSGADPHHSREPSVFCGVQARPNTPEVRLATTFDQVIARETSRHTPLPSLVIGGEHPYPGIGQQGYSHIYSGHSSWSTPTTPVRRTVEPSRAFALLFGENRRARGDASVLDAIRADARRLAADLSADDRRRFDEYQESIRELEQRIARSTAGRDPAAWQPPRLTPQDMTPPIDPVELRERWDLLLDVAVLGLRADRTRVVSFMFENHRSDVNFDRLVPGASNYHGLTHDHMARGQEYRDVIRHHMAALARFAQRLKDCREGDGTLLDHSMVVCASGLWSGATHSAEKLPVVLLGRGSGTIRPGRVIDRTQGNGREMNGLYLALMHRMGVRAERYGDAAQPLEGLS